MTKYCWECYELFTESKDDRSTIFMHASCEFNIDKAINKGWNEYIGNVSNGDKF